MSDSVMYPESGRWVNSYLVGANAYKIMSTPEEAQQLLLDDSGDFLQTGTEHHYIQVRCRNENKPLWLVPLAAAAVGFIVHMAGLSGAG